MSTQLQITRMQIGFISAATTAKFQIVIKCSDFEVVKENTFNLYNTNFLERTISYIRFV